MGIVRNLEFTNRWESRADNDDITKRIINTGRNRFRFIFFFAFFC